MDLCERCLEDGIEKTATEDEFGNVLCDDCRSSAAEAAHERMLDAYYGDSGPQSIRELSDAAYRERRELRRHD